MSPYFCCSVLSFSLKTAGMKSERRNNSAIIAFPLETILRMAWPHRLFSAKKSTMAAGGGGEDREVVLHLLLQYSCWILNRDDTCTHRFQSNMKLMCAVKIFFLPTTKCHQSSCRHIRHDMPASCFPLSDNVYCYKYAVQENAHMCDQKCTFVLNAPR